MVYDVLIAGGGPGGFRAAERAGHAGMTAILFEEKALGGVCLNEGCIPTKTMLYSAKLYDYAKSGALKYGVKCASAEIDHAAVIARKNKVVRTLTAGIAAQMRSAKVEVIHARASIAGRNGDHFLVSADGQIYEGKNLLLACGASAAVPPVPGLKEALNNGIAMTNREILAMTERPDSLLILGGGVIGLEMASYFNSIGTAVTVVEMLARPGGMTDPDLMKLLRTDYEKRGVKFLLSTRAIAVDGHQVELENESGRFTLTADKILIAAGRKPNTQDPGLEILGVAMEHGAVITDDCMRTNVPGVFAAGDINGKSMLAHTAFREAEVAIQVMSGKDDRMDYSAIPSVIYTNPEVASVGETMESAAAKGLDVREIRIPLRSSGRYLAENEGGNGFAKLVIDGQNRIVGACLIGNPASELIPAMTMAAAQKMSAKEFAKIIFPHPTVAEVFRDGALSL